ncbi:hypothetical protein JL722_4857 [Aureococcus anophagefferens]|nr:hypothetical protein JL722_4857 [Aureococcus anophagefferens]
MHALVAAILCAAVATADDLFACVDSTSWGRAENAKHGCAWVASKPLLRCSTNVKSTAGETSIEACPATCGACPGAACDDWCEDVDSPWSEKCAWSTCKACEDCDDIVPCADSTTWARKQNSKHTCGWVAGKPSARCAVKFISADGTTSSVACPVACDTCPGEEEEDGDGCADDDDWFAGSKTFRKCAWVAKAPASRCADKFQSEAGVTAIEACPAACDACPEEEEDEEVDGDEEADGDEEGGDGCSDDGEWHQGTKEDRTCEWVAAAPDHLCSDEVKSEDGPTPAPTHAPSEEPCEADTSELEEALEVCEDSLEACAENTLLLLNCPEGHSCASGEPEKCADDEYVKQLRCAACPKGFTCDGDVRTGCAAPFIVLDNECVAPPSAAPTPEPTPATPAPTYEPTPAPSPEPTPEPTPAPTGSPTYKPTPAPTSWSYSYSYEETSRRSEFFGMDQEYHDSLGCAGIYTKKKCDEDPLGCSWDGKRCVDASPGEFGEGDADFEGEASGPSCDGERGTDSASWSLKDDPTKTCKWVGRDSEKRCRKKDAAGARAHTECVRACESCPSGPNACEDDPSWHHVNKKGKKVDCLSVARNPDRRCGLDGAEAACPASCGAC